LTIENTHRKEIDLRGYPVHASPVACSSYHACHMRTMTVTIHKEGSRNCDSGRCIESCEQATRKLRVYAPHAGIDDCDRNPMSSNTGIDHGHRIYLGDEGAVAALDMTCQIGPRKRL